MKAYKGFNKDMTCRGFQFEEGKTYHEDEAKMCEKGFHACLDPLDCFKYYAPATSEYHEVEIDDLTDEKSDDTKVCGKTIRIGVKLDLVGLIKARFEYTKSKCEKEIKAKGNEPISGGYKSSISGGDKSSISGGDWSSISGGDWSSISGGDGSSLSGGYGSSISGGDGSSISGGYGSSISGGDKSSLSGGYGSSLSGGYGSSLSGGDDCVISGFNSKAKAGLGSLISIANRERKGEKYVITDFASAIVDGKTIKPDTWYTLKNGKFVKVNDDEE